MILRVSNCNNIERKQAEAEDDIARLPRMRLVPKIQSFSKVRTEYLKGSNSPKLPTSSKVLI